MDLLQAVILAIVQGVTEFLPISSSAHLILPSRLLGWEDQGLAFDVAVHLGSLAAVLFVLRAQVSELVIGTVQAGLQRRMNPQFRLALWVVVATLPLIVAGLLLKDWVEGELRTTTVIAATTIAFGLALWYADARDKRATTSGRSEYEMGPGDALIVGLAQCLALVPGTSRSGITMTAGLLVGLSRTACARFSFLLSIPAIAGAATLSTIDLIRSEAQVDWTAMLVGTAAAAVTAALCIRFFLDLLERTGFLPYVIYRIALGVVLILFFV